MADKPRPVTREDVVACYRAFLKREPENDAVVADKIARQPRLEDLLNELIASSEFASVRGTVMSYEAGVSTVFHTDNYDRIQTDVSDETMAQILKRVTAQWTALGEKEPHWAVLSGEEFRPANIDANIDAFNASGEGDFRIILEFCKRNRVSLPSGVCVEVGCGVGRVTRFLANHFRKVIGFDVSTPMVDLARTYTNSLSIKNCDFRVFRSLEQLRTSEPSDFFYSVITLQHNPPPVAKAILRAGLDRLRDGGVFLFQVPTHRRDYTFNAVEYLRRRDDSPQGFDMHVLPMYAVLDTIAETGCRVKEVVADNSAGHPGSHTFFGIKPSTGARRQP